MKFALIVIMASYMPLQGPTITGEPLMKFESSSNMPPYMKYSGPSIIYELMADEKTCESALRQPHSPKMPKIFYSACLPSPSGNLCDDFWKGISKPDDVLHGCIIEIGDGYGATLGRSLLPGEKK